MPKVYSEAEHQELFFVDVDLHRPIPVHIPSGLNVIGHYVCLHVAEEDLARLDGVVTHIVVGGLRPDDATLKRGEGTNCPAVFPSRAAGMKWIVLCRAPLSRGDGAVTFSGIPADPKKATLLLCTWSRFLESGQADDWLACQADPRWAAGGIPLGGIGCGKAELCRDGRFRNFSGNNNQDLPFEEPDGLPGAGLSVSLGDETRLLATRATGGMEPAPSISADLAFPQLVLAARDVFPGIDVEATASASFVPHDLRLSSLPGFIVRWKAINRSSKEASVTCKLHWPNLVGQGGGLAAGRRSDGDDWYRFWEAPDKHRAEVLTEDGFKAIRYSNDPSPVCASADGHHYLAVSTAAGTPVVEPDARAGAVGATLSVPAGGEARLDTAVAWEMPHWIDFNGKDQGVYWQNFVSGSGIPACLLENADRIIDGGGALNRLIAGSDLSPRLKARLANCCYPLITNSVFFKDGRFSINEGPTEMGGCYGTLDQRLGSHAATQLLFPQLNRQELSQFAAYQSPDGGVNHDFGHGNLDSGPQKTNWPDLTCSFIIQLARHAWSTGDTAFEREFYPHAVKAMQKHRAWADEGDGVAQVGVEGRGTSYDGYHYIGTTPYVATLWIAALRVMEVWAARVGDKELPALVEPLVRKALERIEADLWNGSYYRAYGSPAGPNNDNCHAGMMAGEWYARMLAGVDVLPAERLASCAEALLKMNGDERFAVPPDEVSPDYSGITEFAWLPYVECFCLAPLALINHGRMLPVWERILHAMDGDGRHPCDTRLMYRPMTGEPSWGAYYMTAPASWLVYDALLDFFYSPEDGVLRLDPRVEGKFPVVHPLFWGVGEAHGKNLSLHVVGTFGDTELKVRMIESSNGVTPVHPARESPRKVISRGVYSRTPVKPVALRAGTQLRWERQGVVVRGNCISRQAEI